MNLSIFFIFFLYTRKHTFFYIQWQNKYMQTHRDNVQYKRGQFHFILFNKNMRHKSIFVCIYVDKIKQNNILLKVVEYDFFTALHFTIIILNIFTYEYIYSLLHIICFFFQKTLFSSSSSPSLPLL